MPSVPAAAPLRTTDERLCSPCPVRLGHANIGIMLSLYSHVGEGMDRDAADRVAGLFT